MIFVSEAIKRLEELLKPLFYLYYLLLGFLYGNFLYFFAARNASIDHFIRDGVLEGSKTVYFAILIVFVIATLTIARLYKEALPRSIFFPIALILLVLIGYHLGRGAYGIYLEIVLYGASLSIFFGKTFLGKVASYIEKKKDLIIVVALVFAALFALYSTIRHLRFESHAFDLGLYVNAFYKFSRLDLSNSVKAISNLFGDHFHPILIPLSMFYRLWPSPITPLAVQAIIVAAGGIPLYFLTKDLLKSKSAALFIALAYYFYIGLQMAIDFDFHAVTLAPAFYLTTFYFLYKKNWRAFYVSLVPLLMVKEDVSLYVVFLGLYLLFSKKTYRNGLITVLIGVAWFVVVTKYIMPSLSDYGFNYFQYSQSLGPTPARAISAIVSNPVHAIYTLYNHELKATTLWRLFSSFGFLSVLSPGTLFLSLPMVGENLWNDEMSRWFGFHYTYPPAPVFALAAAFGISNLLKVVGGRKLISAGAVAFFVLVCSFLVALYSDMPLMKLLKPSYYRLSSSASDTYKILEFIPGDASVTAQSSIVAHLAGRAQIYNYPGNGDPRSASPDYFVFSLGLQEYPFSGDGLAREIDGFLQRKDYGLYKREGGAFVFKKDFVSSSEELIAAKDYLAYYRSDYAGE